MYGFTLKALPFIPYIIKICNNICIDTHDILFTKIFKSACVYETLAEIYILVEEREVLNNILNMGIVSSRVSAPPWNIDLILFLSSPSKKIINLSGPPTPHPTLYDKSPSKFCRTWLPTPWNVPSSKKTKTHFLKKCKILFPTMK